jgi:hypothetical protein
VNPNDRVKLRYGPYKTPRFKYGDVVFCERAGEVTLCGLSKGRIPWPMCRRGKVWAIALYGALVKAVRRESGVAVQYWWGVGQYTVWKWRKALEVGRYTRGTRALIREQNSQPERIAILAAAAAKAGDPERRANFSAAFKGRTPPPHVMAAAHAANRGRRPSMKTRHKMSETHKRRGTRPPHGRVWAADEDALFRSLPPHEVAKQTGRTLQSVWQRRRALGFPDGRHNNGKLSTLGPWTAEEDALLASLSARQAAERTGRSVGAVNWRRQQLRREGVKLADGRKKKGRVSKI